MVDQPKGSSHLTPSAENGPELRKAFGQFATGVTIVTCNGTSGPMGITANSFTSVSMDPPLILWSAAKSSLRHDSFTGAEYFAIHVLKQEQKSFCEIFSKDSYDFDGVELHPCPKNVPLIKNVLARFECVTYDVHDAGDHTLIMGRLTAVMVSEGKPLIFSQGKFQDV